MAIIYRFQTSPALREKRWLVIADDDTLLRWAKPVGCVCVCVCVCVC